MIKSKITGRFIIGLVLFLLAFDMILAPLVSFMILQYPDAFRVAPVQLAMMVLVFEIFLNAIIFFLILLIKKKG